MRPDSTAYRDVFRGKVWRVLFFLVPQCDLIARFVDNPSKALFCDFCDSQLSFPPSGASADLIDSQFAALISPL